MISSMRYVTHLQEKLVPHEYHALCTLHAALTVKLWYRTDRLFFLTAQLKTQSPAVSLCVALFLPPTSLSLCQCPISAMSSHQGCPGLLGETLNKS